MAKKTCRVLLTEVSDEIKKVDEIDREIRKLKKSRFKQLVKAEKLLFNVGKKDRFCGLTVGVKHWRKLWADIEKRSEE